PNTTLTNKERVVLSSTTQDVDGAEDLLFAAHEGVQSARLGFLAQIGAEGRQGVAAGPAVAVLFVEAAPNPGVAFASGGAVVGTRDLRDGVGDMGTEVETIDTGPLEQEGAVAVVLGVDGHEDVVALHLGFAG